MTAAPSTAAVRTGTTVPDRAGAITVVGPGRLFLSGVSQYTARLAHAFTDTGHDTSVILMRRLCPRFLYPGRARLGQALDDLTYPEGCQVYDGLDWFWGGSLLGALRFLRRQRPDHLVLQWWTGTVAHTYLVLMVVAKLLGIRVVLEFHEVLDVSEAGLPLVGRYVRALMGAMVRLADGVVVHSSFDADAVTAAYDLPAGTPVRAIKHGPFDQYSGTVDVSGGPVTGTLRLLYAGVIRPYKGLEELAAAMRTALDAGADIHLEVVGEVWQDYTAPLDALAQLPADRVTVRTGYVSDPDFDAAFTSADAVVLPYRRSSASGPLAVAMNKGLPVITTTVGGLSEATTDYTGALLVPPMDHAALAEALIEVRQLTGVSHADGSSWEQTVAGFTHLFDSMAAAR